MTREPFADAREQGKSLSLICGALTWLRDHKRWVLENGDDEEENRGAWIVHQHEVLIHIRERALVGAGVRTAGTTEGNGSTETRDGRTDSAGERERKEREVGCKKDEWPCCQEKSMKRFPMCLVNDKKEEQNGDDESEYLLDEYHSDEEAEKGGSARPAAGESNLSPEVLKMLQQMGPQASVEKEEDEPDEIKVKAMEVVLTGRSSTPLVPIHNCPSSSAN